MFAEFTDFWYVMLFYAILSSLIMPLLGYYFKGGSGLAHGYVFGSVLSLALWFTVGKKYAKI